MTPKDAQNDPGEGRAKERTEIVEYLYDEENPGYLAIKNGAHRAGKGE